mgnify:CR=1 FL=1
MTDNELIIKVAESRGWTDCGVRKCGRPWGCYPGEAFQQPIPADLADLACLAYLLDKQHQPDAGGEDCDG